VIVKAQFGQVLSSDACTFSRLIFRDRGILTLHSSPGQGVENSGALPLEWDLPGCIMNGCGGGLDMTIARVIVIVLLLAAAGWVFYTMIYPNLRRGGK
jgi:hypothetical protein